MERRQHHQYGGGRCISIFGYDSTVLSQKYIRSVLSKGGLHLDTPRPDFPPQDLKYAKAVRVVPRPGWAVAAVLRVPVAAPVGSIRSCATTGRLPAGPRLLVAGGCGTAGRGCVSAAG